MERPRRWSSAHDVNRVQRRFHGGSAVKIEKAPDNGGGVGFPPVTTLDAASATRVVAIDLQVFNVGRQVRANAEVGGAAAAMANDDPEPHLQPQHVSGRLVELQPLTQQ